MFSFRRLDDLPFDSPQFLRSRIKAFLEQLTTAAQRLGISQGERLQAFAHNTAVEFSSAETSSAEERSENAKSAAFNTVAPNGDILPGGAKSGDVELKWTTKGTGANSGKTVITFAFDYRFSLSNGPSLDRVKSLFASALQVWADYAPLVFQEIEDPRYNKGVDILVSSDNLDGPGGKLAEAYFPTVGDITFDTDEVWTESKLLETAVHEIGHALGLDHEDDVSAILNSSFQNRFAEEGKPFLFEDDIEGIRSLYGVGQGSVQMLGSTPTTGEPVVQDPKDVVSVKNLIVNGSFEDSPVAVGEYGLYSQINGWQVLDSQAFQVDRRPEQWGKAAEGTAWVELDTVGGNNTFAQNVDTVTGQRYLLTVDFSNGGRPDSTTGINVYWEGLMLDTLAGGDRGDWLTYSYEVTGSQRDVTTLAFRAVGESDFIGGFIDNISVTALPSSRSLLQSAEGAGPGASADYALGAGLPSDAYTAFEMDASAVDNSLSQYGSLIPLSADGLG
ncbi:MAG: matrixin family metalloprotease [Cyanobacteria bacterium J06626_6]